MSISSNVEEVDYKPINFRLLKRILGFLKPYKKLVIISITLTLLTSAMAPIRPYLSKIAFDDYIAKSDFQGLLIIVIAIFGLLLIHGIFQFIISYLMQYFGQNVLLDIRIKLFEHIQRQSLSFFDKNPVGRLVTRVTNDVEVLNQLFSSGFVMIISDILLLGWIICFMFYTNWQLALLTLTVIPFLLIASYIFRTKVRIVFREIRQQISKINTFLNEFIAGITTVRLFSQEANQAVKFDDINIHHTHLQVKSIFYYSLFFPTVEMLSAISIGIILWYTAGNIISGAMTVGTLIAFMQYAEMFFRPVRDLTEKYSTLQSSMVSSERIFDMLDNDFHIADSPEAVNMKVFNDKIEFQNVNFSYDGIKSVLQDVNLEIDKGEVVAVVGATGSGKTTLINLLLRLYDYNDGKILIDGVDIRKLKQQSLRSRFVYVMQDIFLFSRSIKENITLGSNDIDFTKIINIAEDLGANQFINNLELGLDTKLSERGATLSSGQRQLLAFCRAIAYDPEILILDEATANIDSDTERIIELAITKLLSSRTSIIIAHRLSTIKRADKVIVLHHGKVRETGRHEELLKLKGIYWTLYNLQFSKYNSI